MTRVKWETNDHMASTIKNILQNYMNNIVPDKVFLFFVCLEFFWVFFFQSKSIDIFSYVSMKHILWLLMIISDPQHLFLWRYKKTISD